MKIFLKIGYYLLLIIIVAVAVILFLPVVPISGNIETKVVLSGSMEPAISVGSVVVLKPTDEYNIDDVVTFGRDTNTSIPTTHRIVDMRIEGENRYFKTKGDANDDPDAREITKESIQGKVLFSIPLLGYLIDFAKKPIGFALIIIIPAAIIILDEVRKIAREVIIMRRKKKMKARSQNVEQE